MLYTVQHMESFTHCGKAIKASRERLGFSQRGLADAANVDHGNISRYENDEVQPSLKTLEKIARALKMNVTTLIWEANHTTPPESEAT